MKSDIKSVQDVFLIEHEEKHAKHYAHLSVLRDIFSSLHQLLHTAIKENFPGTKSALKKIQFFTMLMAIDELNETMIVNLEQKRFSAAEAVARVALEHTVNFLYVIDDTGTQRALSLLNQHFVGARARANKWHGYAQGAGDTEGVKVAKARLQYLNLTEEVVPEVRNAKPWPNVRNIFQTLEIEHFYHDLFTPASDSVHTLAEDICNLFLAHFSNADQRDLVIRATISGKMSFAIYLCASVLTFYVDAIHKLAIEMKDDTMRVKAEELADAANKVTLSMNTDTVSDILTTYPEASITQ